MHLRAAKEAEEVEAVRRACAHIEAVYDEVWGQLKLGDDRGRDQRPRRQFSLLRRGATHAGPHILFGAHAGDPHGSPGERVLEDGDVIVADIAAQFDGYWGDLTRCAHAGAPSDWAQQAWEVVHEAYVDAVAMTRLGSTRQRRRRGAARDHRGPPGARRLPARRGPRDRHRDPRAAVPRRPAPTSRCARA